MKSKISWYAAALLALAMVTRAAVVTYNQILISSPALAYGPSPTINLQSLGIGSVSAQAIYSTAAVSTVQFLDGSQSTGSLTVVSYAALSSATAVDNVTILSTTGLTGAWVTVPGYVLISGQNWAIMNTTTGTALSLAQALQAVPYLLVDTQTAANTGVIYTTCTYGSVFNTYQFTSNNSSVTVATPFFTGGQDNAYFVINGVRKTQGKHWFAATSNTATAASISSAIINSPDLGSIVLSTNVGAVAYTTSTLNGGANNYNLVTSTPALLASGSKFINGTSAGLALGSQLFTSILATTTLTTALPVLYAVGANPAIGGLVTGTTYYAVPATGNSFYLAKYSTSAIYDAATPGTANDVDLVTVTSTNTQTLNNEHTYSLVPLANSGNMGLFWTVSNDGVNWSTLQISSVTLTTNTAPSNTYWAMGPLVTQYLRLNITTPTAGGYNLTVNVLGTP